MADEIAVEGLRVDAIVGVYTHEQRMHQRLVIDVVVETDIRPAAAADDIHLAVDYDRLADLAREVAASRPFWLIESVAETIAARILAELAPRVTAARVKVMKPTARTDAGTVAVSIRRTSPRTEP